MEWHACSRTHSLFRSARLGRLLWGVGNNGSCTILSCSGSGQLVAYQKNLAEPGLKMVLTVTAGACSIFTCCRCNIYVVDPTYVLSIQHICCQSNRQCQAQSPTGAEQVREFEASFLSIVSQSWTVLSQESAHTPRCMSTITPAGGFDITSSF